MTDNTMDSNNTKINVSAGGVIDIRQYAAGLHGIIAFPIIFGNFLILISWKKFKFLKRKSNILIVNLAFTDLMVGLVMIPYEICSYIIPQMATTMLTCLLRYVFFALFMLTSVTTLLAISVERYIAIAHPLYYLKHFAENKIVGTIIVMWTVNTALCVAPVLGWNNWDSSVGCHINKVLTDNYRFLCDAIVFSCVLLNIVLYARVVTIVMRRTSILRGWRNDQEHTSIGSMTRCTPGNVKHTKVMILILSIFIFCWLPILCVAALEDILDKTSPGMDIARVILLAVGISNSGLNWIIYGWKNTQFRMAFKTLLNCKARPQRFKSRQDVIGQVTTFSHTT